MGFQRLSRRDRHRVRVERVNALASPPRSLLARFFVWLGVEE